MLFDLFFSFLQIGLFSFGGGYAMISLLQQTAVDKAWLNIKDFTDIVAISQITPGPIAVNMATFVGFRKDGFLGALAATLGVSLPSLIIVSLAVHFIIKFNSSGLIKNSLYGLRAAVCGLLFVAVWDIAKSELLRESLLPHNSLNLFESFNIKALIFFFASFVLLYKFKMNTILVIVLAAVGGLIWGMFGKFS